MATDPELLRSTLEDQLALLREQLLGSRAHRPRAGREPGARAEKEATMKVLEALRARVTVETQAQPELGELLQASFLGHPDGKGGDGSPAAQSEEGQSQAPQGGQAAGSPGAHLQQVETPHDVVVHAPMSARASTGFSRISVSA